MRKSIEELEREIEATRARLDHTIDRIQDRLTLSGIVDELAGPSRDASLAPLLDRTLATVRRHPVPVMLAAFGIGLLLQRIGADGARRRTARPLRAAAPLEEESVPILPESGLRDYDPDAPAGRPQRDPLDPRRDESARA